MDENNNNFNNADQDNNVIEMHPVGDDEQNQEVNNDTFKNIQGLQGQGGAAVLALNSRTLAAAGWVSAALSAFVSPYFAIIGIAAGALANRQVKGSGNAIIVTNAVLAAVNLIFGFFLIHSMRRMIFGL